MKNIVFIISSIQKFGGSERVATSIANGLCDEFNVSILSRGDISLPNAYELNPAVNDIKFKGSNLLFIHSIKKYIRKEKPDIVVIHTMSKLTPLLLLSGVKAKSIWSFEHTSFEFHSPIFKIIRKIKYNKLDNILVLTRAQKKIYQKISSKLNVNVVSNPSPFPISNYKYNTSSNTIVSVGSLEHHKGFDLLIDAWAMLYKKYPDWSLHIYGKGSEKENLQLKIKNLGIDNIILKGQTAEICDIYDKASFYVLSSRYEGLPMVLIEAQARGLPLVSFECQSGPAEIINDGVNGVLVPSNDYKQLSKSIELLINDSNLRLSMSEQAKISSQKFLLDKVITSWTNLIDAQ